MNLDFLPTFDLHWKLKLQHNSIPKTQKPPKITCDNATEFECQDDTKRCIPREWVLDNQPDCLDFSDEPGCANLSDGPDCANLSFENLPLPFCLSSEFACPSGRCLHRYRVNDGFSDCSSGADENNIDFECKAGEFDCRNEKSNRCIPISWVNNNLKDCTSGRDEDR